LYVEMDAGEVCWGFCLVQFRETNVWKA